MGFYKKTILLTNQASYENGMAILTIEKTNAGVFGSIKCFNVSKTNHLVLGISVDGVSTTRQNIVFSNSNVYCFKLDNAFQIDGKIGCVLANVNDRGVEALIWGTNGEKSEYKQSIIDILKTDNNSKINTTQKCEKFSNKASIKDSAERDNETIMQEVTYSKEELVSQLFETSEEEVENIIDETMKKDDFYGLIDEQVDELFNKFPIDDKLTEMIPNSKWVRVDYENDGKEYVLGLIYERDDVKYICYGVPSRFDVAPPPELQPYSQWLQLEGDDGFWIMYQDAKTGDSIIVDDVENY